MKMQFRGRLVLGAPTRGIAAVSTSGFNALAAYCDAIVDKTNNALCADRQNAGLYGRDLAGCVLCASSCTGSTTAGPVWEYVTDHHIAPKALLLSRQVDSLTAGGLVLAEVWIGKPVTLVDRLGDDFLAAVRDGSLVCIEPDGHVWIQGTEHK